MKFRLIARKISEELFPLNYTCDLCGIETFGTNICKSCLKSVTFNNGETCPVCGRKTFCTELCMECKDKPPRYKKAVSPLVYDGGGAELILKFKRGSAYLKEFFADLICAKLGEIPAFDGIVCVPLTKKSKRRRGYNQSLLLAKSIEARTGTEIIEGAVVKVKESKPQKGLNRSDREENLHGCFKVGKPDDIKGKKLLLVDDVLTTGATADEVTETLLKAGAKEVYLATVASVENNPVSRYKTQKGK